jgi:hypothetical protein
MSELGDTGKAIWAVFAGDQLDPGSAALVRELARCADTLDRLDDLVTGRRESWITITFDDMGEVHLGIDKLLDTRRSHQLAFKQLTAEVRSAGIRPAKTDKPAAADEEPGDMLAAARKAKADRERQLG